MSDYWGSRGRPGTMNRIGFAKPDSLLRPSQSCVRFVDSSQCGCHSSFPHPLGGAAFSSPLECATFRMMLCFLLYLWESATFLLALLVGPACTLTLCGWSCLYPLPLWVVLLSPLCVVLHSLLRLWSGAACFPPSFRWGRFSNINKSLKKHSSYQFNMDKN